MVDAGCCKKEAKKAKFCDGKQSLPAGRWEKSCLFLMPRNFNNNMAEIDDCDFFFALARSHLSRFPSFFKARFYSRPPSAVSRPHFMARSLTFESDKQSTVVKIGHTVRSSLSHMFEWPPDPRPTPPLSHPGPKTVD